MKGKYGTCILYCGLCSRSHWLVCVIYIFTFLKNSRNIVIVRASVDFARNTNSSVVHEQGPELQCSFKVNEDLS